MAAPPRTRSSRLPFQDACRRARGEPRPRQRVPHTTTRSALFAQPPRVWSPHPERPSCPRHEPPRAAALGAMVGNEQPATAHTAPRHVPQSKDGKTARGRGPKGAKCASAAAVGGRRDEAGVGWGVQCANEANGPAEGRAAREKSCTKIPTFSTPPSIMSRVANAAEPRGSFELNLADQHPVSDRLQSRKPKQYDSLFRTGAPRLTDSSGASAPGPCHGSAPRPRNGAAMPAPRPAARPGRRRGVCVARRADPSGVTCQRWSASRESIVPFLSRPARYERAPGTAVTLRQAPETRWPWHAQAGDPWGRAFPAADRSAAAPPPQSPGRPASLAVPTVWRPTPRAGGGGGEGGAISGRGGVGGEGREAGASPRRARWALAATGRRSLPVKSVAAAGNDTRLGRRLSPLRSRHPHQ